MRTTFLINFLGLFNVDNTSIFVSKANTQYKWTVKGQKSLSQNLSFITYLVIKT